MVLPFAKLLASRGLDAPRLRVLDVGCGQGEVLSVLGVGAGHVGIDIRLPRAGLSRLQFVRGDAEALPFRGASWDAVVSLGTLEHVRDAPKALREIRRVLKPEGVAIIHAGPSARLACLDGPEHRVQVTRYVRMAWFTDAFGENRLAPRWAELVDLRLSDATWRAAVRESYGITSTSRLTAALVSLAEHAAARWLVVLLATALEKVGLQYNIVVEYRA